MEEKEIFERLTRIETKLDELREVVKTHQDRHFQFSKQGFIALVTSVVSVLIAIFR